MKKNNNKTIEIIILIVILLIILVIICLLVTLIMNDSEQSALDSNSNSNLNLDNNTSTKSHTNFDSNQNYNMNSNTKIETNEISTEKPIIYIYTTQKNKVSIKLGNPQYLSCTYPKYKNEWNVIANPDGTLIDITSNRKLYALYWEGKNLPKKTDMVEGFCVKGGDTAKFLEEKLETLGLNEREAEEFIIYWLPKMENNNYNYIRFETIDEQNNAMPLTITPAPDNLIRIMMDWKALDNKIEVKEQILETPKRKGYTVVEWGGSELK